VSDSNPSRGSLVRHLDSFAAVTKSRLRSKEKDFRYTNGIQLLHDDSTLTVEEVAQWLRVTEGWVREHASGRRRPKLPSEKFGKYIRFRWGTLKIWRVTMERFT
jgi:hypothetical protein